MCFSTYDRSSTYLRCRNDVEHSLYLCYLKKNPPSCLDNWPPSCQNVTLSGQFRVVFDHGIFGKYDP